MDGRQAEAHPLDAPTPVSAGELSRRRFLAAGTGVLGGVVLVACGSPAAPTSGGAPPGGATPGGAQAAGGPLVALDDLPVGGTVAATSAAGDPLLVTRTGEATAVAFSAVCTHRGCTVEPDGADDTRLVCPCHGSVFEAGTGANVSGPAPRPLDAVAVQVSDGQVTEA